ncbi:hypothetical protein GUITHDRAFT_112737 [Guillardia theta CCMP2712]|uniref:TRUD domain-containing protein n=1 Tax=Guillardia theta (strain CCMP2712) TaxID=905079 RepID=L1IYE8_GUITC|nr:hypothetical protein GUITHDRAFT_112737 [Guillardia theta CCMP2712]EKX41273.1 hypothetical protein GUITHDRAFT_112737 [Guillardia theta CCMP2712]|eukprot:XP_005828253.1 hypothetical protein GUITHDRAFT_112737 [Guillardia theta CCMP2712]
MDSETWEELLQHGGMVSFMNESKGFQGSLKDSAEDFVVNEIDLDGNVIKLEEDETGSRFDYSGCSYLRVLRADTQTSSGPEAVKKAEVEEECAGERTSVLLEQIEESLFKAELKDLISEEAIKQVETYAQTLEGDDKVDDVKSKGVMIDIPDAEAFLRRHLPDVSAAPEISAQVTKLFRSACHHAMKTRWPWIKTTTVDGKFIKAEKDAIFDEISELLVKDDLEKLQLFAVTTRRMNQKKCQEGVDAASSFVLIGQNADRACRTKIHQCISRCLPFFRSTTETKRSAGEEGGASAIRVERKEMKHIKSSELNKKNERRGTRPQKFKIEDGGYWYTAFVLRKEHVEHLEAISRLADALQVPPSYFSYHGTKDKVGITTQLFAVRGVKGERLAGISNKISRIRIGKISTSSYAQPLSLGHLLGNRFQIRIREISAKREVVEGAVGELGRSGFFNYFGSQRVGRYSADHLMPHRVGASMMRGDFETALKTLLYGQGDNKEKCRQAIDFYYETKNISKALKMLPRGSRVQEIVLKALQRNGHEAHLEAIKALPHGIRSLHLQSYQSFVFNCMVSLRMRKFGRQAVEGDLVWSSERMADRKRRLELLSECADGSGKRRKLDGGSFVGQEEDEDGVVESKNHAEGTDTAENKRIKTLTKEDIASGSYGIQDVILPLPGRSVIYPDNEMKEEYRKLLAQDDVDFQDPTAKLGPFASQCPGGYRQVVEYIKSWDLLLSFNLPKSCYATSAIREMMKECV